MKKTIVLSAFLIFIITVFTKCKKDSTAPAPAANFNYTGQGLAPSVVSFTNSSVNATSYFWDFGDGSNSTLQNPSHTFTKGGIFTVTLTAYSGNALNTFSQSVLITSPTKVTITKVELATLTVMPSGSFQAFLEINDGTNVLWTEGYYNLNSTTIPVDLLINTPYTITNFSQVLYLQVDENTGGNGSLLGYVTLLMNLYTTGVSPYPTSVPIANSSDGTGLILYLSWQ